MSNAERDLLVKRESRSIGPITAGATEVVAQLLEKQEPRSDFSGKKDGSPDAARTKRTICSAIRKQPAQRHGKGQTLKVIRRDEEPDEQLRRRLLASSFLVLILMAFQG